MEGFTQKKSLAAPWPDDGIYFNLHMHSKLNYVGNYDGQEELQCCAEDTFKSSL